jgi:hypothetical protein
MASVKLIASQARTIFQYKNNRIKVLKCYANIYFNKQCLLYTLWDPILYAHWRRLICKSWHEDDHNAAETCCHKTTNS